MSVKHLTTGSPYPPMKDGLVRLFSMKFCPFAARVHQVFIVKNIPHEIVNINLEKKPEWYSDVVPSGKVPALLDGEKIVEDSVAIVDYLDEKYPSPPLYPSDPKEKEKVKKLLEVGNMAVDLFVKCLYTPRESDKLTAADWAKQLLDAVRPLEKELAQSKATYFGGATPGIVDYVLYPFAQGSEGLSLMFQTEFPVTDTDVPHLCKWKKEMSKLPVSKQRYISPEVSLKFFMTKDYDVV